MRSLWFGLILFTSSVLADGQFRLFKRSMTGPGLSHGRDVYVYLPVDYGTRNETYKVLYMHDGQNLFDPSRAVFGTTWNVQNTLNELIRRKIIPPLIVVAIDNTPDRSSEYIPELNGDLYLKFISRSLKPLIDNTFKTKRGREHTAMIGSSLGGLISIHAGITYFSQFGLIGALSPSIWWNNRSVLKHLVNAPTLPVRFYLDSGTIDGERPHDILAAEDVLLSRGQRPNQEFMSIIDDGASHNEEAWSRRFPLALEFLFSK